MGLVGLLPTLGYPCHSHARRCGSHIHRGYGPTEGRKRRQVMEPDARLDIGGQYVGGGGGSVARPCGARRAGSPWCSRRWVFRAG